MSSLAKSEDPDEDFIRIYTVCKGEKVLQTKEYNTFLKIIT